MPAIQPYEEKELLQRIAAGDEQAFAVIFDHYYPLLYTYINRITRVHAETESILQDVFLKIWQGREALEFVDRFSNYLWVMARHHALNAIRNLSRRQAILSTLPTDAITTGDDEQRIWQLSLIDEAIRQLPEHCRKVWTMNRIDKMKQAEIAREMGISLPTVKKYMQQAVSLITQHVKNQSSLGLAIMIILTLFSKEK
ncbi:RNA polymerase, sigma subunit, ECF family [Chitinophaga jiangningensis]|uniref:RNA polymerase, sigma subunit, ECF family n=1 Tax=Chitinophaga jiangningensis TaxID=1419482 RepID=A0A1M7LTH4_9BACT|nr:sigma-70 family RNA polymerase sigma factor [Chitinophaga jiangningensis]SHM81050.1 RNA polymerase, sigma subunit, ECF family [Chitinophaga jiangningensis]